MDKIMNTFEKDAAYIAPTYQRFPLEIVRGSGALLYGSDGKEYIDLGSGIAVNIFGACDSEWVDAVTRQASLVQHTSNLFYSEPCARLAELLCEKTGMSKVFFGNSGAEANECAIKIARKYAAKKKGAEYCNIVTLKGSFHGRTLATLAATGQDVFHKDFLPLPEGFLYAEPDDIDDLRRIFEENKVAGVLLEPVQGEGGVRALSDGYLRSVRLLCDEYDAVMMCDEVQTGNGRTGKLYAYMHAGILPDVVTTAKGLGGGLPIGCALMSEKMKDVFKAGDHGSTFGGNPIAAAGAVSILSRIDDALLSDVERKAAYIRSRLENAAGVKSVSGRGLMIGIETVRPAGEVIAAARENGVLALKAKEKVRLLPPINIDDALLSRAMNTLIAALKP